MHHLAVYAGSFDPITLGHIDVLERSRSIFDEVILAIGINIDKPPLFTIEERREFAQILVERLLKKNPKGAKIRVESYNGLTTDFARKQNASAIIRGIRNVTDLASECQLAITNRQVAEIETVFILTGESFAYVSSSLIKQSAAFGGDLQRLSALVPPEVIAALESKRRDPNDPLSRLAKESAPD